MNFIDLFAGAGGLSEGFIRAGFKPVAHVEMDKAACNTLLTRTAYHHLKGTADFSIYIDYLRGEKVTRDELYKLIPESKRKSVINLAIGDETNPEIFKRIDELKGGEKIDLIVGGPPCQAYSLIGRHGIDWENDHRLKLYMQYRRFLKEVRPKAFVFENVPGIISANRGSYFLHLKKYFSGLGYEIDDRLLNAKDYGVLQNRKRVIIVGWRKDIKFSFPELVKVSHNFIIEDVFSDLSPLSPGQAINYGYYINNGSDYLKTFNLRNGTDFYTQHISRPHNNNDLKIYRIAIEKWEKEKKRLKYIDITESLRTQKNTNSFLDRFKVVDGKGISHTVVAHISKDGHYYIHPDINQCRSISVREAARIQSFPDDYFFEGSRTAAFNQIGNAVPPLLSLAIANGIKNQFIKI